MIGLGLGIVVICLVFAFIGVVIFREAFTHRFWQRKVNEGDLEMITQLVQVEVQRWRTERPPKGMPASIWQGIQNVEVVEVDRESVRVSTTAEPQFALVAGQRKQVSSAIDEAKRVTAKLAERFFYDIPHIRPARVQIDCYTTVQDAGAVAQRCIMTTAANRADAALIDWDSDPADVIAERLGARYELDSQGAPRTVQPDDPAHRIATNGHHNGHSIAKDQLR
jgi:hypothetical protein